MKICNVIIERDGFKHYVVYCAQLQGCSAHGSSVEDALLMFADALRVYMKSMLKHKEVIKWQDS